MGGQYQRHIQVNPNETVDSIRHKVPFFSLFSQRNYKLVTDSENVIERDQLSTLKFEESGLRNGSRLKMMPPQRERESKKRPSDHDEDDDCDE